MKKLFTALLLSSLLFSACGGSETTTGGGETTDSEEAFYFTYETAEFQIEVPDEWEVIDSFTSEYPKEMRAAFRNNVKNSTFTANVTVFREDNEKNDTSYDFAQRKLADHEETLLNYELLSQEVINLTVDGAETKTSLSTFSGKNDASAPGLIFMQVALTQGDKAWSVTASYREGEDAFTVEELTAMLKSFTLK